MHTVSRCNKAGSGRQEIPSPLNAALLFVIQSKKASTDRASAGTCALPCSVPLDWDNIRCQHKQTLSRCKHCDGLLLATHVQPLQTLLSPEPDVRNPKSEAVKPATAELCHPYWERPLPLPLPRLELGGLPRFLRELRPGKAPRPWPPPAPAKPSATAAAAGACWAWG